MTDISTPPAPVASSDPWFKSAVGAVAWGTKVITDWLAAAFPLGAAAWTAYTPTVSGLTLGTGGTVSGRYTRVGRRVRGRIEVVLGTGFSFTGDLQLTLPVQPASGYVRAEALGRVSGSGSIYELVSAVYSVTTTTPLTVRYAGTNNQHTTLTNSQPSAWSAGGRIIVDFAYEAAE